MRRALILLIGLAPAGCLVERPDAGADAIPEPVQKAFDNNCALGGCHDAATSVANLSLARGDSADILDKATPNSDFPLVAIGDLYGSYLALKLLDDPSISGEPMPLGGTQSHYEIAIILSWIAGVEIPDQILPPPAPPSPTFTDDVYPIIEDNCSCHQNGGSGTSTLVLDEDVAYENIFDVDYGMRKFVDPGNPRNSQIWLSVTDTIGVRMPASGGPLEGYELQIIRDWIEADAPQ